MYFAHDVIVYVKLQIISSLTCTVFDLQMIECGMIDFVVLQHLRQVGVVGKFVEFYGPGVSQLSIADRATISNMCPEYGATVGFFAVDDMSMKYLKQTGEDYSVSLLCLSYMQESCSYDYI